MSLFLLLTYYCVPAAVLLTFIPIGAEVPEGYEDEWGFHFGSEPNRLLAE